jgi:predicted ferric reductase
MTFHKTNSSLTAPSKGLRVAGGALTLCLVLGVLAGAAGLPYLVPSDSLLYKFGAERTMLRWGKVLGLVAACLLQLQLVWSARLRLLDRIFALNNLYSIHGAAGIGLAAMVLVHPLLTLLPDDMLLIPLQPRYWPEFVGVSLLALLAASVLVSAFRRALGIPYRMWRLGHRVMGAVLPALLFTHVLSVSSTFEAGAPRSTAIAAACLYGMGYLWVLARPLRLRKGFMVSAVEPAGAGSHSLRLKPLARKPSRRGDPGRNLPGQFAFLTLFSRHLTREEHPFTIASAPSGSGEQEFIIRESGDWTRKAGLAQPGDRARVDGPYGLFTHLRLAPGRELIMIAGGIGITPMLSMLRSMADDGDRRSITLVWSNKSREHIVFPGEIEDLEARLPGLRVFHVFTEDPEGGHVPGRLDRGRLAGLLEDCGPEAAVFMCGPPAMMRSVFGALRKIGYSRRAIFTERFSL